MAGYGKIFPMEEYYEKKIKNLEWKFRRRKSGKIICPFHADDKPSLGFIRNKDGSEIYHCFGCGVKGDIVKLHQGIEREYHGRDISREQALKELCQIFDYPYEKLQKEKKQEEAVKIQQVHTFYERPTEAMTLQRFEREFIKAKKDRRDIRYFNSLLIQKIMTDNEEREHE